MGTCGGKQDVISQSTIVTIETASEDARKVNSSRKQSEKIVLPTAKMIERQASKTKSEISLERKSSDAQYQTGSPEQHATEEHDDLVHEFVEENSQSVDADNDNEEHNKNEQGSQTDIEVEHFNDFEHEAGQFDVGYQRIINTNMIGDSDGEWLEVINEVDELELENGDEISLVESEIIENCANNIKNGNTDVSDRTSIGSGPANKEHKKSLTKVNTKFKRTDSNGSGKSVKNEKRKTDKDKVNKTKQDKLWTSRSQNKSNWMDEKVYTTKGKDGVLFKIKIMKRASNLEEKKNKKGKL